MPPNHVPDFVRIADGKKIGLVALDTLAENVDERARVPIGGARYFH
jgi:hypothetical protein